MKVKRETHSVVRTFQTREWRVWSREGMERLKNTLLSGAIATSQASERAEVMRAFIRVR
jgi:hypothetical protein